MLFPRPAPFAGRDQGGGDSTPHVVACISSGPFALTDFGLRISFGFRISDLGFQTAWWPAGELRLDESTGTESLIHAMGEPQVHRPGANVAQW